MIRVGICVVGFTLHLQMPEHLEEGGVGLVVVGLMVSYGFVRKQPERTPTIKKNRVFLIVCKSVGGVLIMRRDNDIRHELT